MTDKPILVIGSTGKTGRRILSKLEQAGHAVRAGSRGSTPPFDWQDRLTWSRALAGVRAIYVSYFPDLAVAQAPEDIRQLMAEARSAGVERIVLLSGRGEQNAIASENIVRESGLAFTLVRASWFNQNFDEGQLLGAVMDGVIAMPAAAVREPFIDVDDIADVAVAALTEDGHNGKLYEVTGPRLLSFEEVAVELSRVTGRPVRYQPISLEVFNEAMKQQAGQEMADMLTALCREVFDGRNEQVTSGVEEALGRVPRDFTDYAEKIAATGIWSKVA